MPASCLGRGHRVAASGRSSTWVVHQPCTMSEGAEDLRSMLLVQHETSTQQRAFLLGIETECHLTMVLPIATATFTTEAAHEDYLINLPVQRPTDRNARRVASAMRCISWVHLGHASASLLPSPQPRQVHGHVPGMKYGDAGKEMRRPQQHGFDSDMHRALAKDLALWVVAALVVQQSHCLHESRMLWWRLHLKAAHPALNSVNK